MDNRKRNEVEIIKVSGVPIQMKETLENIAKNSGYTTSRYVKRIIRDFIRETPAPLKKKRKRIKTVTIKVSGVPVQLVETLENIAKNLGYSTRSDLIKMIVRESINLTPDNMKMKD